MGDSLFWRLGIRSLADLLPAWRSAGLPLRDSIDGGAYQGRYAALMSMYCSGRVFAYEPVPANIGAFQANPRVVLREGALSDRNGYQQFVVPEMSGGRHGNPLGYLGGSATGRAKALYWRLGKGTRPSHIEVPTVRGDDDLPADAQVDLIKLDLQGGEPRALDGMRLTVASASLMWIECTGSQPGLLKRIQRQGFAFYETAYRFEGAPTRSLLGDFEVEYEGAVGLGARGWVGVRKTGWRNFGLEFQALKRLHGLVQTDMICVRDSHVLPLARALIGR